MPPLKIALQLKILQAPEKFYLARAEPGPVAVALFMCDRLVRNERGFVTVAWLSGNLRDVEVL